MERNKKSVFEPALKEMANAQKKTYGPESFRSYTERNGLESARTWKKLSVDSIEKLDIALRRNRTMVFRLGSRPGESYTHFALAECLSGWDDYFLLDGELADVKPELFIPRCSIKTLFVFQCLPKLTEPSLVNLAITSGLVGHALEVDQADGETVPATGQTTFTFQVCPHTDLHEVWEHINGQVEVDALFMGKRNGKETLFVVEAKSDMRTTSIAKHKLVYALTALRQSVPGYIPVVPVYLRVQKESDGWHFLVVECSEGQSAVTAIIANLVPCKATRLVMHGLF